MHCSRRQAPVSTHSCGEAKLAAARSGSQRLRSLVFCDHVQEAMLPVEWLGKSYFVVAPSSPGGAVAAHSVTLVGAHDGTHLDYEPAPPPGAPLELAAGEAVSLGIVESDFRVSADHPFLVSTFLMSAEFLGTPDWLGDPSQTAPVPLEGFGLTHTLHLRDDMTETWADVVAPLGAQVLLDGTAVVGAPSAIGTSGFGVHRLPLGPGDGGRHTITADAPVSVQVLQYANAVSVAYPASLQFSP
ncbi:MAG: IgGFc-binding protein [Polyangiaceae bacterium]